MNERSLFSFSRGKTRTNFGGWNDEIQAVNVTQTLKA